MKIREIFFRKYDKKTNSYSKIVYPFKDYKITRDETSEKGYRTIEVVGPKQTFFLCSTVKPLKKLYPPLRDGENAIVKEMQFFYVTGVGKYHMPSITKIQGATNFALDGDELIPYVSSGRGLVRELEGAK